MNGKRAGAQIAAVLAVLASAVAVLDYLGVDPFKPPADPPTPVSRTAPPITTAPAQVDVHTTTAAPTATVTRTTTVPPRTGIGVIIGPPGATTLTIYSQPTVASAPVQVVAIGTTVTIVCTAYGAPFTGPTGTSRLWDRLLDSGYVPDSSVSTGTDQPVAPPC